MTSTSTIRALLVVLALSGPVFAQEEVVRSFYGDYVKVVESHPRTWVQELMARQKEQVETELHDLLVDIADNRPGTDEAWLDFDPFSNSQMGVAGYSVGEASHKDGLAYVPVFIRFSRGNEGEQMRARAVLRESDSGWKIANFAYPAEGDYPGWDLKGFLKQALHR